MDLYFINKGYVKTEDLNEWTKGSWTIRITEDSIEAFQDLSEPDYYRYTITSNTEENLFLIVDTIEDLE